MECSQLTSESEKARCANKKVVDDDIKYTDIGARLNSSHDQISIKS